MKTLKKIHYHQLENLKTILKVEEIFCLPVFQEGFSEKEIEKINMDNFISVGKRNYNWYFSNKTNDDRCEKIKDIYFSKSSFDNNKFEYFDYLDEIDVYIIYLK